MRSGWITGMACVMLVGAFGCVTVVPPHMRPVHLYPVPKRPVEELALVALDHHGTGGASGEWNVILRGVDGHPPPAGSGLLRTFRFYVPPGEHFLHIRTQSDSGRGFDYEGRLRIEVQAGRTYRIEFRDSSTDPSLVMTTMK